MKKYNSFLGAFFSGDNGQGGYNAAYGKSALAKLYTSQDPAEKDMAFQGLTRIDPQTAIKYQQEHDAMRQESLKRKAMLIANAPAAQRGQLYASVLPDIRKDWADAPEQYTPELDGMVTTWAQTVGGAGNKGKYTGAPIIVQTENGPKYARYSDSGIELTQFAPDDRFTMNVDAEGNVRGYNTRRNVLAPTADASAPQPVQQGDDPMAPYLERIRMGGEVLAANNIPPEQINAWKEAEFAKAQQQLSANGVQVTQTAPQPARVAVKGPDPVDPLDAERKRLEIEKLRREASGQLPPAKQAALAEKRRKEVNLVNANAAKVNETVRVINEILASDSLGGVTGMGAPLSYVPGSKWADTAAKLETLRAKSAFGALSEMRANSPTGGALGSVTERELALLQNAETQLSTAQSPKAFREALQNYKRILLESQKRMVEGLNTFYSEQGADAGQQGQPTKVNNAEDYNRLPSGARYIDPNGTLRVKK